MRLIFETHATSVDNEAGLASGWFDVALSQTGEQQAALLGVRRRHDDLAAVFCSDLTRSARRLSFEHLSLYGRVGSPCPFAPEISHVTLPHDSDL